MKVLGIDPGTAVLGYGVVESGSGRQPRLMECGTLTTRGRDPLPARLRVIHDGIDRPVARHAPDAVAVESAFYGTERPNHGGAEPRSGSHPPGG